MVINGEITHTVSPNVVVVADQFGDHYVKRVQTKPLTVTSFVGSCTTPDEAVATATTILGNLGDQITLAGYTGYFVSDNSELVAVARAVCTGELHDISIRLEHEHTALVSNNLVLPHPQWQNTDTSTLGNNRVYTANGNFKRIVGFSKKQYQHEYSINKCSISASVLIDWLHRQAGVAYVDSFIGRYVRIVNYPVNVVETRSTLMLQLTLQDEGAADGTPTDLVSATNPSWV